jgi:hypothetical protein
MKKSGFVVEVTRGCDGKLESVIRREPKCAFATDGKNINAVVIDRENRRGPLSADVVCSRGKMLAGMLGIPYRENLKHDCVKHGCGRLLKLDCHCCRCHS